MAVEGDAQDLAVEQREILRSVIVAGRAAVAARVASGVADRDVEEAVGTDVEVAAVVVAVDRRDVVQQHGLARGVDAVIGAEGEPADPVDAPAPARPGVVQVHVPVRHERRVVGEAEQPPLAVGTHVQIDGGAEPGAGAAQSHPPGLLEHHDAVAGYPLHRGGRLERGDERVAEPGRDGGGPGDLVGARRDDDRGDRCGSGENGERSTSPAHDRTVPAGLVRRGSGRAILTKR